MALKEFIYGEVEGVGYSALHRHLILLNPFPHWDNVEGGVVRPLSLV